MTLRKSKPHLAAETCAIALVLLATACGGLAPPHAHPVKAGPPLVTAQTAEQAWQQGARGWLKAHQFPPREGMTPGIVASATASGSFVSVTWTLTIVTATGRPGTLYCVNGQVHRDCPWLPGPDVLGGAASINPVGIVLYFRNDGAPSSPHDTRVITREW